MRWRAGILRNHVSEKSQEQNFIFFCAMMDADHDTEEETFLKRIISNTYRGFTANIHYSEDDAIYVGTIEEIQDHFRGRTVDEALKRFHDVVDRHINGAGTL